MDYRTEILEVGPRPSWWTGRERLLKMLGVSAILLALVVSATVVWASHPDPYIDLASSPGLSVTHDEAIFMQGGIGAGTGNFDPFTTANPGGSTSPEEAITVCDDPGCPSPQFHTHTGGGRTHEILLSAIPELSHNGGVYREFTLDANDQGSDDYMSIDDIQILLDEQVDLTGFNSGASTFSNDSGDPATLEYALDMPVLMRSQSFTPGSGVSDITLLVPTEFFDTPEDCSYGSTECTHYVYFYFKAGAYDGSAGPESLSEVDWDVTSGFEEWRTRYVPVVDVSKTVEISLDREYDWTVEKTVDKDLALFDGQSGDVEWTVTWTRGDPVDSNIVVSGTIEILNPTGSEEYPISEAIPATINVVSDVVDLGAGGLYEEVAVDCGVDFPYELGAGETLVCTYSQTVSTADFDGTNTATVNIDVLEGTQDYEAVEDVLFSTAEINEIDDEASLTDSRAGHSVPSSVNGSGSTSWTETFTCDADEGERLNTVTLTEGDSGTSHESTATTTVTCYTPTISKTATATYGELHEWEVDKSVDPSSLTGFIGGTAGSADWTVTVTETVTLGNYKVEGTVTITNPHPSASMAITLSDNLIGDGTPVVFGDAACDGNDGNPNDGLTVDGGETVNCDYSAFPSSDAATGNHAEFTFFGITYSDDENFTWQATVSGPLSVDLTDIEGPLDTPVPSNGPEAGTFTSEFEYTNEYVCPSDKSLYVGDGAYHQDVINMAFLMDGEGLVDDASAEVDVDCYAPLISKTAAGEYDENHDWSVDKEVDPGSLSGFIGGTAGFADWLVIVTETVTWSDFEVSGVVTIQNPNPSDTMSLSSLSDALDDATPGVFASDACTGSDPDPTDGLDIPASGSVDCAYTAMPSDTSATQNTATATLNGIDFLASDPVEWSANLQGPTQVSLTDDEYPLDETVFSSSGAEGSTDYPFPYTNKYVCSSDKADYAGDGHHEQDVTNTAVIEDGDTELDSATADLAVDCYAPLVSKDSETSFDRTYTWDIDKTASETELMLMPGQIFAGVEYTITVDVINVLDDNFGVGGAVTITNTHPTAVMTVGLSDMLDDGTAAVFANDACDGDDPNPNDGLDLAGDETVHCQYSAAPTDRSSTENAATVTINSIDFTATAPVNWNPAAADVSRIDECVDVVDSVEGFLGTVCAGAAPAEFKYTKDFGPYTVDQCGEFDVPNEATFTTNDTAATGSDDHNVHVTIPCPTGCTLTQGYWKTHNDSFHGGAPTDDTWELIVPVGEESPFFLSGQSWFEVFWTAPKGNVYYNLAHQYMAARLNQLNEASVPAEVQAALDEATALFETYTPEQVERWRGNNVNRRQAIELAGILGDYNEGLTEVPHCDEDDTSVPN